MPKYQVKNWSDTFENDRSRRVDECRFVCLPNKSGMGLRRLLAKPRGHEMFGVFVLLVEALSTQSNPREGWLTDDGKPTDEPWTASDVAIRVSHPDSDFVAKTLEILASKEIGWLAHHELTTDSPPTHTEWNGKKEEKELLSGKPDEYPPAFMELWHAFPRVAKDRSSKKQSLAAWKKIPADKRTVLLAALDAWKCSREWVKESGKFIPGAHRWLSTAKWEDLPEQESPSQRFDKAVVYG